MNSRPFLPCAVAAAASALALPFLPAQTTPLDPEMQAVLAAYAALGPKALEALSPAEARRQPTLSDAARAILQEAGDKPANLAASVDPATITVPGRALAARVYTPQGTGPFPLILYFHGGGFVVGDLDSYDATPRALCGWVNAMVISVHYRQAPEHKLPAAHEDAVAVYQWALRNEDQRNYIPTHIAVVGEGAGANLAASLGLRAKELGWQMPVHQVLVCPVANLALPEPAVVPPAQAQPWSGATLAWFGQQALARPEDAKDPRLSPVLAGPALRGLPSATVIVAEADPRRAEGEALAQELKAQGVWVHLKTFTGVTHDFFGLADVVDKAREAQALAATNLSWALLGKGPKWHNQEWQDRLQHILTAEIKVRDETHLDQASSKPK